MSDVFMHLYSRNQKLEPIKEKPKYVNSNYYSPVTLSKRNMYMKDRLSKFQKEETNVRPKAFSPDFTINEMNSSLIISQQEIAPRIAINVLRNYDSISLKKNSLTNKKMPHSSDFPIIRMNENSQNVQIHNKSKDISSKLSLRLPSSNKIDENKSPVVYPHDVLDSTTTLHSSSIASLYHSINVISTDQEIKNNVPFPINTQPLSTSSSNNPIATMLLNPILTDHGKSYQQISARRDSPIKFLFEGKPTNFRKSIKNFFHFYNLKNSFFRKIKTQSLC